LLSRRMRVPRASVDAALRRMVDDKLLDGSRGGARIPLITTVDVLDLYAARMAIGEVVLRSLSLRPQRYLVPVQLALRQVEAAAPTRSGIDVEDADLHFQQELARASGLRESARAFESLTLRLRLFISVLQLDYSPASDRIVSDDRAMFRSLARADARTASEVWRGKVDNAVRRMGGLLGRRRFDQELWTQLTRSLGLVRQLGPAGCTPVSEPEEGDGDGEVHEQSAGIAEGRDERRRHDRRIDPAGLRDDWDRAADHGRD